MNKQQLNEAITRSMENVVHFHQDELRTIIKTHKKPDIYNGAIKTLKDFGLLQVTGYGASRRYTVTPKCLELLEKMNGETNWR